jgi:hypothetical protein
MLTIANNQKCRAYITPLDAHGNPAALDGPAVWRTSSADIFTIENISTDTLSVDLVPGPAVGTAELTVHANAGDLGGGIEVIYGVLSVQIVPVSGRQVHISTDEPELLPQPPPTITALSPSTAPANTDIPSFAIDGTGFDVGVTVNFGTAYVKPDSQTPTLVTCHIGAANVEFPGVVNVSVTNGDLQSSAQLPFTVT